MAIMTTTINDVTIIELNAVYHGDYVEYIVSVDCDDVYLTECYDEAVKEYCKAITENKNRW